MSTDAVSADAILAEIRDVVHPNCRIAGSQNPEGLQLKFHMNAGGDVEAEFDCESRFQGYSEIVHGGVVAAMMDSAMVNYLFAKRIDAVTAELVVRYHHPVRLNVKAAVRARLDRSTSRIHFLSSEVLQDGIVCASSKAKFMALPPALDQVANSPGDGSSHS